MNFDACILVCAALKWGLLHKSQRGSLSRQTESLSKQSGRQIEWRFLQDLIKKQRRATFGELLMSGDRCDGCQWRIPLTHLCFCVYFELICYSLFFFSNRIRGLTRHEEDIESYLYARKPEHINAAFGDALKWWWFCFSADSVFITSDLHLSAESLYGLMI